MRYRGRARVSRSFPQAHAICDRCGFRFNHVDLHWSFDWQGPRLANQRILVCNTCDDVYFEHNRTILIPADPVPIANPRPEHVVLDNNPISPLEFDPLVMVGGLAPAQSTQPAPAIGVLTETGNYGYSGAAVGFSVLTAGGDVLREDNSMALREDGSLELRE